MYYALIHSYLRYGIAVWGNATANILKPLQTIVNKALRIMTFAPFGRIDLEPIYKELYILDVKDTFILETSKFMFKLKKGLLPVSIGDYFGDSQTENRIIPYNLRNRDRPRLISTRLSSSENTIRIRGERVWNYIPEIVTNTSFQTFKRLIKYALIEL